MSKVKKEEIKEKEEKVVVKKETPMSDSDKKKKMIQICFISVGLIIVLIAVLVLTKDIISQEEKLSKSLTRMGEEFYTEFYYSEISKGKTSTEVSEFLSKFQDVGIKVNLETLSRYNDNANEEEIANFKNDNGTECNKINTRAVIYPISPYGKNDYKIEAELDCGFETNEK